MTDSRTHDAVAAGPLMDEVDQEVETFYGAGAYDTWPRREKLAAGGVGQIIPPRKGSKIKQHGNSANDPVERDECVRRIRRDGKEAWKESIGYHRRRLAETAMSRLQRFLRCCSHLAA